jgi:glycolate oxidase iron-sulfur subunit
MKPLDELTAHCIRCGFCLESCPTFVMTGEETESPRGRIYLVRSADEGKLDWKDTREHLSRCLGCRACETACPSGVEYGAIFEIARDRLERQKTHYTKRALLKTLTSPKGANLQLKLGHLIPGRKIPAVLSKMLSGQAPEANKPSPQKSATLPLLEEAALPAIKGEVYLLEGCVMRVLFPRVHEATRRLLRRVGYVVRETPQGCCGSLHLHAGYMNEAKLRSTRLIDDFLGDLPIIVNSAGCGSTMKGYGELFADAGVPGESPLTRLASGSPPSPPERRGAHDHSRRALVAQSFANRVFDASEFLFSSGLIEQLAKSDGLELTATYHDACHLAHGQRVRTQPRQLLQAIPNLRLVDLDESDMCCGSAGIYNLTQPQLARQLLERKWNNIEATGANVVAMGNPGCHAWIAQAALEHGQKVEVLHTMELLEASFIGSLTLQRRGSVR